MVTALNAISFLQCEDEVPQSWIDNRLQGEMENEYVQRIAAKV